MAYCDWFVLWGRINIFFYKISYIGPCELAGGPRSLHVRDGPAATPPARAAGPQEPGPEAWDISVKGRNSSSPEMESVVCECG